MCGESSGIVHRTGGDDESHRASVLDNGDVIVALDWHRWWFFIGPLLGVLWLLVVGGLLRWTFSRRGSLAGASRRPSTVDNYGHLRPLYAVRTQDEASQLRGRLSRAGIRSTLANTADGLFVMVWAEDLDRARDVANWD